MTELVRYRIRVVRAQKIDRTIRAIDEDDAARKLSEELARPYGYIGQWETVSTDIEVLAAESSLPAAPGPLAEGALLLALKDAATHLGISRSAMYELVNRGEVEHVRVGSRMYIARQALLDFITANSHRGYWRP
jgi:excisionase family DNA binding protein